jgi:uncharacterized membrane protein
VDGSLPPEPTVNSQESDLESLRSLVHELAARVERLERRLGAEGAAAEAMLRTETQLSPAPPPPPPQPVANTLPVFPVPPSPTPQFAAAPPVDLESRIGSHWLNRIGISAVLIGVSYFLKFAFDNNWIGPTGRVSIGLLAGIAVIVWSESFRRRDYKIFSYSLKAVGVGVLYLSLWAAFQVYGLIPSAIAFLAMAIVTASTAALAIKQDAEILAAIALTGGFATPLLLSTGQNREIQLFSYVALLSAASVVLVAFKPWRRLLVLSYVGTLVLYIAWYAEYYRRNEFAATLAFATIFFTIFAVAPLVSKTPERTVSLPYLAGLITFVNTGVYFLQAYAMFEEIDKLSMAWFALALAAVHIGLSRIIGRREPANAEALRLLHLALAVALITIAIPIRLDGHWITVGWLVEAGVLLWVADRIGARFLHYLAAAALALGVVRLLAFDNFQVSTLLLNSRMATYLLAMVVLALLAWFSLKRFSLKRKEEFEFEFDRQLAAVAVLAVSALALVGLSREIGDYYARQMYSSLPRFTPWQARVAAAANQQRLRIAEDFTYSALWMAYGALLMVIGFWRKSAFFRWQALFLIAATIVKVFIYDVSQLDRGYRILSFMILGVLLLAVSFVYQKDWLKLSVAEKKEGGGQS